MDLTGMRALVTGASRGIGRQIAIRFAELGADVAVVARDASLLDEVSDRITEEGRRSVACVGDVTREDDVSAIVDQATAALGPIDALVNNAGRNIQGLLPS